MTNAPKSSGGVFSLATPEDLFLKLHYEALALHNDPPADLTHRAYAVMNAVTTAWQMKDWVYKALDEKGELDRLSALAKRDIPGLIKWGDFLTENSTWLDIAFQLATKAKHLECGIHHGNEARHGSGIERDPISGEEREELIVATSRNSISGTGLVICLAYVWEQLLKELKLLPEDWQKPAV